MDTDSEIRRDEYYRDHLGMCGTCYWKRKNIVIANRHKHTVTEFLTMTVVVSG